MFLPLCIFFLLGQLTIAANPCQTPTFQFGDCRPLSECQTLVGIQEPYKNTTIETEDSIESSNTAIEPRSRNVAAFLRKSRRVAEYLRRSHCGFTGTEPKVCCPLPTTAPKPEPSTVFVTSDQLPESDVCGTTTRSKIRGGEVKNFSEFPWMALLEYNATDKFQCGGSIINKRYVLTAAHCVDSKLVSVRLGEWNTKSDPDCLNTDCVSKVQNIRIEEKIVFRSYMPKDRSKIHDIALLRLQTEIEYNDFVKPICLPTTVDEVLGYHYHEMLTVAGLGARKNGLESNVLRTVDVPVTFLNKCEEAYKQVKYLVSLDVSHICAGGEEEKDSCRGDSGGPLMLQKRDEHGDVHFYAIGIVSFGSRVCGVKDRPGVYVRVSKYMYWIVDNLRP